MDAWVGSPGTYESSLNRNLAMNEGTLSRKALGGQLTCLSRWLTCLQRCPGGELVRLVSQARRGRHMFLGCCHHGNGSSKEEGGAHRMEPCY